MLAMLGLAACCVSVCVAIVVVAINLGFLDNIDSEEEEI